MMHTRESLLSVPPPQSKSSTGRGVSSVVRAPGSWLKGHGSKSLQKWWENFLVQGHLFVLTRVSVSVPPCVAAVAHKRSRSFRQAVGGRLQLTTLKHLAYVALHEVTWCIGCMVYTEHTDMAAFLHGTSHASAVSTPLHWIFKNVL